MRSVERAVRYEIQRQAAILAKGGTITQETRHWHEDTGVTSAGRPKSDADDYRYFPEPDLLPIEPSAELIEKLRAALPEAPAVRRRRLREAWGFTELEFRDVQNAGLLVEIEETVAAGAAPGSGPQVVDRRDRPPRKRSGCRAGFADHPASGVGAGRSSSSPATSTTSSPARSSRVSSPARDHPSEVVAARGLKVVSDDGALIAAIDAALAEQPDVLEKIREGKVQAAGAIIGAVMKAMGGSADAGRVRELVLERAQQ